MLNNSGRAPDPAPLPHGTPGPDYPPARLAWSIWALGALLYLIGFYQRVAPAVITDRLMQDFAIGGAALGNLSAFYFYSYVVMQIPTGIIADRWGPRRLLTLGAGVAAAGTVLFALAPSIGWASAGRLLIGASVAVAFVSMLKLATHWFAPSRFAVVSGMALFMGVVGGVLAGVPLRALVELFGWRPVMIVSAALTGMLCLAIWLNVRDDPQQRGYRSHMQGHGDVAGRRASVWRGLMEVLSYRNSWLLLFAPIGIAGSVLAFAGLWGVPYLMQVYGLGSRQAAAITSGLLVAWALGGPILGAWSQRMGRRKPIYAATCVLAAAGWAVVIFAAPLPLPLLVGLLAMIGFASGNLIIGFAFAKESVPARLMGTASGVCNMGPLLGGMILQPAVGWMLDRHWGGAAAGGARLYDAAAFEAGFALMFGWVLLSVVLMVFTRETHCRQSA